MWYLSTRTATDRVLHVYCAIHLQDKMPSEQVIQIRPYDNVVKAPLPLHEGILTRQPARSQETPACSPPLPPPVARLCFLPFRVQRRGPDTGGDLSRAEQTYAQVRERKAETSVKSHTKCRRKASQPGESPGKSETDSTAAGGGIAMQARIRRTGAVVAETPKLFWT